MYTLYYFTHKNAATTTFMHIHFNVYREFINLIREDVF